MSPDRLDNTLAAERESKSRRAGRQTLKAIAYGVALLLLAASIWFALGAQTSEDWQRLVDADPAWLAALLATVLMSAIILPGVLFWLATIPFVTTRHLSLWTMMRLIAASALLNYTPLKAGLIGRVGYLRYLHGVGYAASVVSHGLLLTVFGTACLVTLLATLLEPRFGTLWALLCGLGLLAASCAMAILFQWLRPAIVPVTGALASSRTHATSFMFCCLVTQCSILLSVAVRWWIVFQLLDQPIDFATAWLLALLHAVTQLFGPANGLGLREWLVGAAGASGVAGIGGAFRLTQGLSAALLDRAVEALVVVVIGTLGLLSLRLPSREDEDATSENR